MARKRRPRKSSSERNSRSMQVVYPNAAGIDIGSESHFVAVPNDNGPNDNGLRDNGPRQRFERI